MIWFHKLLCMKGANMNILDEFFHKKWNSYFGKFHGILYDLLLFGRKNLAMNIYGSSRTIAVTFYPKYSYLHPSCKAICEIKSYIYIYIYI
jgi:hypothetical protein